jgi:hypothetical protein
MPLMVSVAMSKRARTSIYEDRAALTHHHQFVREQRLAPVHQNTVASKVIRRANASLKLRAFRWNQ